METNEALKRVLMKKAEACIDRFLKKTPTRTQRGAISGIAAVHASSTAGTWTKLPGSGARAHGTRNEMALSRKIPQFYRYAKYALLTVCPTRFHAAARELESPFASFHNAEVFQHLITSGENAERASKAALEKRVSRCASRGQWEGVHGGLGHRALPVLLEMPHQISLGGDAGERQTTLLV